jgi:hypothetical protein
MSTPTAWRVVRVGAILLTLVAIVVQAKVGMDAKAFDPTRFFAYFTIQSNLIGVVALAVVLARGDGPRSRGVELLRAGAAIYLTVTFFVVIVLLSNIDVGLQLPWVDVVLHKVFPVIVVLDWLIDPPRTRLAPRDIVALLAYPLAWTVLTMIRGELDPAHWYPYPFLNPANGGYGTVAITIVAVLIGFIAISWAIIWLGNQRRGSGAPELRPA